MNHPFDRSGFRERGFCVIRNFLADDDFSELQQNLQRLIREVVPTMSGAHAFFHDPARPETLKQLSHMDQDPYFAQYKSHPRWTETAAELLGEPAEVQGVEWFNKPPGTDHETPPHQDNYYFCLSPPNVLTMWLALEPVDLENGCLRYIPGSHLEGIRPHQRTRTLGFSQGIADYNELDRGREVAITAEANDLLVHMGNTIHRADANRSPTRHRRSFAMVVRGVSCQRNQASYDQYLASLQQQHEEIRK